MKNIISQILSIILISVVSLMFSGCDDDDPKKEDTPELITRAILTFTPTGGGNAVVVVTATDPDGEGIQDITVDGPINVISSTTYVLTISLVNGLAAPSDPEYNISAEVEEEGDEHMLFFAWTNDVFSDPAGNGNMDNRNDAVNYTGGTNSKDANNLPLGLTTTWTVIENASSGTFRVLLKHQPGLKSGTSDSDIGETDLDVTFTINVLPS